MSITFAVIAVCLAAFASQGAVSQPAIKQQFFSHPWPANWITCPGVPSTVYGVYHFRTSFDLSEKPERFVVHVSADNRYRLFVNGKPVCIGPARGSLDEWRYETVDIAPSLRQGSNVIAAQVWNLGDDRPLAQMSLRTAFILQADSDAQRAVNTGSGWGVMRNAAYQPIRDFSYLKTYSCMGAFDSVDASAYPWGWQDNDFDDHGWAPALQLERGKPKGSGTAGYPQLVPRTIPFLEELMQRLQTVRRSSGIVVPEGFLKGTVPMSVPRRSTATVLLDQAVLTAAYPELMVSGGKGSRIRLTYGEALFDSAGRKGNRGDIAGKEISGFYDVFMPDGGAKRVFRPLWLRTYRYLQLDIQTGDDPLTVDDLHGTRTLYPLNEQASFESDDRVLRDIWDVGWRTARLCAIETYVDCPYYEQLQYAGDTRIQSLISLYVSGDDRLARNAIQTLFQSRTPDGLTLSRYPCSQPQVIPPFSLFWINLVCDYHALRDDRKFVMKYLSGVSGVLDWFEKRLDGSTGILGPLEYWNFVDWTREWPWDNDAEVGGVPDAGKRGASSILSLQFAYTLNEASRLFAEVGEPGTARHYRELARTINMAVVRQMWDKRRGLLADTPEKMVFSQHANAMAVLSGAIQGRQASRLMEKIASDTSIIQCTIYYRFYLLQAMKRAGLGDRYLEMLTPWRSMLANGLTTFPEKADPTRSDCHAWSASPNYDLLATVCGIEPAEPGFRSVKIEPHLGSLSFVKATMPHPDGAIRVELHRTGKDGIRGTILLPGNIAGRFIWKGRATSLHGGENEVR